MLKVRLRLFQRFNTAVDGHGQVWEVALKLIDTRVVQGRDLAVLFGTEPREPGLAGMDNKRLTLAPAGNGINKAAKEFIAVLIVNADAGLHRHRNRDHVAHGFDAVGHQLRIAHQAGPEHAVLHAIGRTTNVEVDLIVAAGFGQLRTVGQLRRIAAAQLKRHGMLFIAVGQIVAFAVNNRPGGHHLGVEKRLPRQQTQKIAAVAIGPVEHGRDGEAVGGEGGSGRDWRHSVRFFIKMEKGRYYSILISPEQHAGTLCITYAPDIL